ncbi:cyclic beta 1-2 glucan synthetase [Undibacterium sp. B2R-29]|nr:cyclic beta 1-2 glucan synthetase [Undibacterium crateris]
MEQYGQALATTHKLSPTVGQDQLLSRLAGNEDQITAACTLLTASIQSGHQVTPAAAWLLDNFYLIEDQIRTAKHHFPKHYSKQLPRLIQDGQSANPRVYDIALELISHGDGRIDPESLSRFITAYQSVAVLKLGELWAIPIMLRLALIENLRRVATRLINTQESRKLAIAWADEMILTVEKDPSHLIVLVADMSRSGQPLDSSFVAELVRRLQGRAPTLTLPLNWLSQRLAEQSESIEQLVQQDSQHQAADQISISNSIHSLRCLSMMDWRQFVESMSAVEKILYADPASVYASMDFLTRDRYRHGIEELSRLSHYTETEVAQQVCRLAQQRADNLGAQHRESHIGYYLVDAGISELRRALGVQTRLPPGMSRYFSQHRLFLYLAAMTGITLIATGSIWIWRVHQLHLSAATVLALAASVLICSQFALSILNWLITLYATPSVLPRMDFSEGIPADCSSLVVVATVLNSAEQIDQLSEAMEIRFLANRDPHLRFCLLSDFTDAQQEVTAEDTTLKLRVVANIAALNKKYPRSDGSYFLLLHRNRLWNPQEKIWMSFERKRGKLSDLNSFLRGSAETAFSLITGDPAGLKQTRYVITLDSDTELPRGAAAVFIATMAHRLNQPVFDANSSRVIAGYGILQPRIAAGVSSPTASHYEQLYSADSGMDPYTHCVSDVYQDLFAEGSFIGKGIYEVNAFEQVLKGKMPINRILSHDLLEGCYARSGLMSDGILLEASPSHYLSDMRRHHRWIRGDWQLCSWLLPQVPGETNASTGKTSSYPNPLSALSRWKLFDNLRRSLLPAANLFFLSAIWLLFGPATQAWQGTVSVMALLFLPAVFSLSLQLLNKPAELQLLQHLAELADSARIQLSQAFLKLCFIPYEASVYLDAILRTQWRMQISHQHLLEWTPSHLDQLSAGDSLLATLRRMWVAPAISVVLSVAVLYFAPAAWYAAAPLLLLWIASPWIAYRISLPKVRQKQELSQQKTDFLHRLSRKTWLFFETHVGPEDNWLPPDNIQQHPVSVIAHRTSPTNIGLSLLANLSASEFGYISMGSLLTRTGASFASLQKMERYHGHFLNWYDTQTLTPLQPMYVSTVDSGNFCAHCVTLKSALSRLSEQPLLSPRLFQGLRDTWLVLLESASVPGKNNLLHLGVELDELCRNPPQTMAGTCHSLNSLRDLTRQVQRNPDHNSQTQFWLTAMDQQIQDTLNEMITFAPWVVSGDEAACLHLFPQLAGMPSLSGLAHCISALAEEVSTTESASSDQHIRRIRLIRQIHSGAEQAALRITEIAHLITQAEDYAFAQYGFLYNKNTRLLSIGYNVSERRTDTGNYDLLASEARLASYTGIAQGQLPQESWFALGRQLTVAGGEPILLSWSGSMFEYLMPLLVMPVFSHTLLEQTYHSALQRQIQYGGQRGVPWGISESGYNAFDTNLNYQYRAFGVPGLGYKRGLGDDLVIAPYASFMALMVAPDAACDNLLRMAKAGFEGAYGFYEAIDYTAIRLPRGQSHVIIRSFMAHHQGMALLALAYHLLDQPMQKFFAADPLFKAALPLLHESIPRASAHYANTTELADIRSSSAAMETPLRVLRLSDNNAPEVQLLSNGRYHVMISSAGGGYSRWHDLAVTRWDEDSTRDHSGSFCYVRDIGSAQFWSTTLQPAGLRTPSYEAVFSEGRAEFRRSDQLIDLHTEIVVSPEDNIELRRTRITNRSGRRRTLELTSYAEVVLAPTLADKLHPAFSKLFVQTEILPLHSAILCTRRPRSADEKIPMMLHLMALHGSTAEQISYETDRSLFIGRGNTLLHPAAMHQPGKLSDSQGSVLDPVVAIRYQISLDPEQSVVIDLVTGVADNREQCLGLIEKYRDQHLADRVIDLSWTHSQVVLRQLNISEKDAQLYARLANSIIYANPLMRAPQDLLKQNQRGQSALWSYAISGDMPIVLLLISSQEHLDFARQLIQAHAYWQARGLAVDLVIWNEDHASYRQILQDRILGLISSVIGAHALEKPGGIYVRASDQISNEDRILFHAIARVILNDQRGTLTDQLNRYDLSETRLKPLLPLKKPYPDEVQVSPTASTVSAVRQFDNGIGSFSEDGKEYLITSYAQQRSPAPWVNVLANPGFGTVISESGPSYSWSENAHEFRLSPWHNDPVCDSGGEVFYIRDEESGQFWSPTALPCHGKGEFHTRHGYGYSIFSHQRSGILSELCVYVDLTASVKYAVLTLRNHSAQQRKLSATAYVEWVLGDLRSKSAMHIVTEPIADGCGIAARNAYNSDFSSSTAFFCVDQPTCTLSADRCEFIGRYGSLHHPAAMGRSQLSGKTGAGLDPCAALQVVFDLKPEQEKQIVFILGVANQHSAKPAELIRQTRSAQAAKQALLKIQAYWEQVLGQVQVQTPDQGLNFLANGWLLYQTISCRLWARSGYYQSGGAYGFRDQLQDTIALAHTAQDLARQQILLSASHQFIEGDVQHWWHPPADKGVRTHCSDDYLWLPYAVAHYLRHSGDSAILQTELAYLEGREVHATEDSYFDQPIRSNQTATLYQHCVAAIEHGLRFGRHGLPLMGSCDWNDGMDKVGHLGQGESVWLAFFYYELLSGFAEVAQNHNDPDYASHCRQQAERLQQHIASAGWDGAWYRRAYFDDGSPLGSATNKECQIDSISQSWAVLSGAGDPAHRVQAMESLHQRLMDTASGVMPLLAPPFDQPEQDPGYIRGYLPGIRENGGQYNHAAIWAAMAFAKSGQNSRAWQAFNLINPIRRSSSADDMQRYKVEPYVMAADVYALAPHTGRGGWTWYTGSAGWMYTLITASLLGLQREANFLSLEPCLPAEWDNYQIRYRYLESLYCISVQRKHPGSGPSSLLIDDLPVADLRIPLINDGRTHQAKFLLEFTKPEVL